MLSSPTGVRCHLPRHIVLYPRSLRTSETNAFSGGIKHDRPGKPSATSLTVPIPLLWALRPVSSDARVGEHNAVVWNCVNCTPDSAIRRIAGVSINPPYRSHDPKPMSSQTTNNTFGAPSGARGSSNGRQSGTDCRTSRLTTPLNSSAISNRLLFLDRHSGPILPFARVAAPHPPRVM